MAGVSLGSWLLITVEAPHGVNPEVLLGMLGPLAIASVTWIVTERTFTAAPERVLALFIRAFAGKVVFFALYVAVMLRVFDLRPTLFVVSFTAYFIALFVMQTVFLHRLFNWSAQAPHS